MNGQGVRAWTQSDLVMANRRYVTSNGQQWSEVTEGAPARNALPEVEGIQSLQGRGYAAGGGTLLRVPSLQAGFDAATTFKPYSATEALSSAIPSLPYIAPSQNSCGAAGQPLIVIVAVIVSFVTCGAASGWRCSGRCRAETDSHYMVTNRKA